MDDPFQLISKLPVTGGLALDTLASVIGYLLNRSYYILNDFNFLFNYLTSSWLNCCLIETACKLYEQLIGRYDTVTFEALFWTTERVF